MVNKPRSRPAPPGPSEQIEREAQLRFVPINEMRVSTTGQRYLNRNRVDYLVANLVLENLGYPIVSFRDGYYYIIDGQHRIEALKAHGFEDSSLECFVYDGLTEEAEAEQFLSRNDVLSVSSFDKFRIGVTAGREAESQIAAIVEELGLKITRDNVPGAVRATGTLKRLYIRAGADVLRRTLLINREVYSASGALASMMVDAIGLVVGRYGNLDDAHLINKLLRFTSGAPGLIGKAEVLRQKTGQPKAHCLAAELVGLYNSGSRHPAGGRLTPWWKSEARSERERQTA